MQNFLKLSRLNLAEGHENSESLSLEKAERNRLFYLSFAIFQALLYASIKTNPCIGAAQLNYAKNALSKFCIIRCF